MTKQIENIRNFVLQHKAYFLEKGGVDIPTVRRKYRSVEGISIDRKDTTEALIEMRKDGLLTTNWKTPENGV
jgi:hypothetical protein|tara:strand:+ start:311 stop:526 length:216 start_codon:yes stop_codon:yes gene_type:complete